MRLRVHTILSGRYWKAGEEIPDEDVPPNIRKYALSSAEPVPQLRQTRGTARSPTLALLPCLIRKPEDVAEYEKLHRRAPLARDHRHEECRPTALISSPVDFEVLVRRRGPQA